MRTPMRLTMAFVGMSIISTVGVALIVPYETNILYMDSRSIKTLSKREYLFGLKHEIQPIPDKEQALQIILDRNGWEGAVLSEMAKYHRRTLVLSRDPKFFFRDKERPSIVWDNLNKVETYFGALRSAQDKSEAIEATEELFSPLVVRERDHE